MRHPGQGRIVELILKHRILTAICAVFLILVVILFVSPFIIDMSSFKPRIESSMSAALGMEVHIDRIEGFSILPAGLSLKDLTIENRGYPVARTGRAEIGFELLPLIKGRFHIRELNLGNPEFTVIKIKDGKYNFEKDDKEGGLPSASLQKLVMSDGIIHFRNEKSGNEMWARQCDVVFDDLIMGGEGSSQPSISFTAECSCKEMEIGAVTLSDLELRAKSGEEGIGINPIKFTLFGGEGKGDIKLDLKPSAFNYRIQCELSDFRIGDMLRAFSKKSAMEGEMDFSAALSGGAHSVDEVKRTMDGEISLTGKDLAIHGIDLDGYIESYEDIESFNLVDIGAFFLAGPVGSLITMQYDFAALAVKFRGGKSAVPKFISVWNVQDGVASARDVAMTTKKNRIALRGSIDFVGKEFEDLIIAAVDDEGCAIITQKISGSFRKPEISRAGPLETLVKPLTNLVKEAGELLKGGRCDVFYDGSVKQPD
jgi:AsmA protein